MARLRLRELAEARKLTMSQVQRQTGLTIGQIRRYWYNDTSQITLEAIDSLAQLLHVEPGELLGPGFPTEHERRRERPWVGRHPIAREVGSD